MTDPTQFQTRCFEQALNDGPGAIFEYDVLNRRTMTDPAPCQRTRCFEQALNDGPGAIFEYDV